MTDLARRPYLAGDAFTDADYALIPYILRPELLKLAAMWRKRPAIADCGHACGNAVRSRRQSLIACRRLIGHR